MFNQIAISSFHHDYFNLVSKYNKEHDDKIEFGYILTKQKKKILNLINLILMDVR